jgi:DNA-binding response OmpR family regulator
MTPVSVMLIDDNPTFLRATKQFLEAHDDVVVVGTANRGDEALARVEQLQPQVVLVDLAMPGLPGLETIPRLRRMMPKAGIIALTVMNSHSFRKAALEAGADLFIHKGNMRTDLLPALQWLVQPNREELAEAAKPFSNNEATSPKHILIIEDDAYLRRLYSKALRTAGYEVHSAGTVEHARELLVENHFDLLLCDINLGNSRGTDLLYKYADALATNGAQVVMVSGQPQYRDVCAEMGADFFLEKPVSINTLVTLVNRLTARGEQVPAQP